MEEKCNKEIENNNFTGAEELVILLQKL